MAVKQQNGHYNLTEGPIAAELMRMTTPMILGMLMLFSFNLIDTFFISMLGTEPLAAISFTFPITFTVVSLAIGLGIGTSAVVARHLGEGDHSKAKQASTVTLYTSMSMALILSLVIYACIDPIFLTLGASEDLLVPIRGYMHIWLPASALIVGIMTANSVLRASGDTRTPSMVMAAAGAFNAIMDPLLIFGLGPFPAMGISGAATATLISWIIGFTFLIYTLAVRRQLIEKTLPSYAVFIRSSRAMLRIGIPASGANMITPLAAGTMTYIAAGFGETTVAAFGVGSRIETMACLIVLALSSTLPPFISQNFGAGRLDRIREAYRLCTRFVLFWQLLVYLVLVLSSGLIAGMFSSDPEVIEAIKLFIWILPLGYGLQGVIILTNSSLNALHKPMQALALSGARFGLFYVPFAFIGSQYFGLYGFFAGALLGNLCMAAISWQTFRKTLSGEIDLVEELA